MKERKLNRLKGHDYSGDGYYYFVTVCTKDRAERFGAIKNGRMVLNQYGKIVSECWSQIPDHYPGVSLDEWVIMPNHIHGIVMIVGTEQCSVPTMSETTPQPKTKHASLSWIVKSFKDVTTKQIRANHCKRFGWQRSFHDHIIRHETALNNIREYIRNNPLQWDSDPKNLNARPTSHVGVGNEMEVV